MSAAVPSGAAATHSPLGVALAGAGHLQLLHGVLQLGAGEAHRVPHRGGQHVRVRLVAVAVVRLHGLPIAGRLLRRRLFPAAERAPVGRRSTTVTAMQPALQGPLREFRVGLKGTHTCSVLWAVEWLEPNAALIVMEERGRGRFSP